MSEALETEMWSRVDLNCSPLLRLSIEKLSASLARYLATEQKQQCWRDIWPRKKAKVLERFQSPEIRLPLYRLMVSLPIRNQLVVGSNPTGGSTSRTDGRPRCSRCSYTAASCCSVRSSSYNRGQNLFLNGRRGLAALRRRALNWFHSIWNTSLRS